MATDRRKLQSVVHRLPGVCTPALKHGVLAEHRTQPRCGQGTQSKIKLQFLQAVCSRQLTQTYAGLQLRIQYLLQHGDDHPGPSGGIKIIAPQLRADQRCQLSLIHSTEIQLLKQRMQTVSGAGSLGKIVQLLCIPHLSYRGDWHRDPAALHHSH